MREMTGAVRDIALAQSDLKTGLGPQDETRDIFLGDVDGSATITGDTTIETKHLGEDDYEK